MGPKPHVLLYRAAITAAKDALMDQWFPDEKIARLLKETDPTRWKDLTASILNIRICKCLAGGIREKQCCPFDNTLFIYFHRVMVRRSKHNTIMISKCLP